MRKELKVSEDVTLIIYTHNKGGHDYADLLIRIKDHDFKLKTLGEGKEAAYFNHLLLTSDLTK